MVQIAEDFICIRVFFNLFFTVMLKLEFLARQLHHFTIQVSRLKCFGALWTLVFNVRAPLTHVDSYAEATENGWALVALLDGRYGNAVADFAIENF